MAKKIPDNEINVAYVRSSGPGGQNVNKVATKAEVRWCVGDSVVASDVQKQLIRSAAGKRLNSADEIVITSDNERSQARNKAAAIQVLQDLVDEALRPVKKRRPTKPSRAQKRRRLDDKRRQSDKKQQRKPPRRDW